MKKMFLHLGSFEGLLICKIGLNESTDGVLIPVGHVMVSGHAQISAKDKSVHPVTDRLTKGQSPLFQIVAT